MELWGKEVSQLWGRRPPFIVGGANQPLSHSPAPHRAVLPLGKGGTTAPGGTTARPSGTAALPGALAPGLYYRVERYYRHYYRT